MAKPEWGVKRLCTGCGARFYDMQRDPIVCPKCGVTHDPLAQLRPHRQKTVAPVPVGKAEPKPKAEDADFEEEGDDDILVDEDIDDLEDDTEEDEAIEDASELGEDKDDMFEVIDNVEDDDDEKR